MGFLQSLGNAVKENVRSGLISGFLNATNQGAVQQSSEYQYDSNGKITGINTKFAVDRYGDDQITYGAFEGNNDGKHGLFDNLDTRPNQSNESKVNNLKSTEFKTYIYKDNPLNTASAQNILNNNEALGLKLPNWDYGDFINERNVWQKQIGNIFDEPGWFYFKIFFDFNTYNGLFGSILNAASYNEGLNCAIKYLSCCKNSYVIEDIKSRMTALYKFTSILSYICAEAPWYFKEIHNIDKLSVPLFEELDKAKTIEITTLPDAIDMRLSTLMSLYQYACYDNINHKEIIPENLRKFNMSIVIFQSPLRYLHTSYTTNKKTELLGGLFSNNSGGSTINYKSLNNATNMMSFKIYSLYGCEFDIESFSKVMPNSMSNESPFNLGKNNIVIKYDSVTEHTMNEFYEIMYGTNGFYFNQYSSFQEDKLTDLNENFTKFNKNQLERYKALSDTFGDLGQGGVSLFGINLANSYNKAVDASEAIMHGMFENNSLLQDVGTNFVLGLLGSSKTSNTTQGNIYGDYGINSEFFKEKLKMLKEGIHINTKKPYEYDPNKAIEYEYGKLSDYSALDYENIKRGIQSFNLGNWLKNGATNLGSNHQLF